MEKEKILITGATGQIGTVLTGELRRVWGEDNVIATDIRRPEDNNGLFEELDVLDGDKLNNLISRHKINQIYHLAAILSAKGEQNPRMAWEINMSGLFNVLEAAKTQKLKVFFPSSIAVFGRKTPRHNTPQFTVQEPESVYGISKVAGESWCQYYNMKYGVDVRSVRYPGIISYQSMPGGGTTDYAVEIFHYAVKGEPYECFLKSNARLPMLYMPDAIRGTLELMEAPAEKITIRTSYNLAGMSFTPFEIASEIQKYFPDFKVTYNPDYREAIAESWPAALDDRAARRDWGWEPEFDLPSMTTDMLTHLQEYYQFANVNKSE